MANSVLTLHKCNKLLCRVVRVTMSRLKVKQFCKSCRTCPSKYLLTKPKACKSRRRSKNSHHNFSKASASCSYFTTILAKRSVHPHPICYSNPKRSSYSQKLKLYIIFFRLKLLTTFLIAPTRCGKAWWSFL